jgi:hypothetical protein
MKESELPILSGPKKEHSYKGLLAQNLDSIKNFSLKAILIAPS